jgi:threonine dehydrogenase-like Zn-dependent dehydrogenase
VDVVAEVTGTQAGLDLSVDMVRQHGVLTIPGYHQGDIRSINMQLLNLKAVQIINAHETIIRERVEPMKRGIKLVESKKLDMKSLITHEYGLKEINRAFNDLEEKPHGYIKGYINLK